MPRYNDFDLDIQTIKIKELFTTDEYVPSNPTGSGGGNSSNASNGECPPLGCND